MRDFSKVSPSLWRSKKFRSVQSRDARYVYQYLLTCPHGNSAGCFDLHPMYACADLDMAEREYRDSIQTLCDVGLIEFDEAENTVLVTNWLEFNAPANAKHAVGILSQLAQASSEYLKAKCFETLAADIALRKFDREAFVRNAMAPFFERYRNGIATETKTETKTETETETETETRPDQDLDTRTSARAALRTVAAKGRDGLAPNPSARGSPGATVERLLNTTMMRGAR